MNTRAAAYALFYLALFVCQSSTVQLQAQLPAPIEGVATGQDAGKGQPKEPDKDKKAPDTKLTEPPQTDIFSPTLLPRAEASSGFNPHMMGDFPGYFSRQSITVFGVLTTTTRTNPQNNTGVPPIKPIVTTVTTPISQTRVVQVPVATLGAFKIADNASPRPVDRVFFTYNNYNDLRGPQSGPIDPINATQTTPTVNRGPFTTTTSVNTFIPGVPPMNANLNREVFGFEKTFFDGRASVEMRLPLLQQSSSLDGFSARNVGDLTIIGKYAFILDRTTGNVLSAGLAVTAPTGRAIDTIDGSIHSTLLQPWFGYIWNADRFFVHAFHSVVVPTDARDVTLLFNDVGLNYWLYRGSPNRLLSFVVPMAEVHVTTPLNNRDANSPLFCPDLVVMTGGAHVGLGRNTTLSFGAATPVTGPRLFGVEGFMQLNWRF